MKKIGLVGGTGPESTLVYYKELNQRIEKLTDGKAMPNLCIESVNFPRTWRYVVENRTEQLSDYLAEKVTCLLRSGAETIALTSVTMHMVIGQVEAKSGVKLISIPKAVRDEILGKGIKKAALLGTIFTMEQDYLKKDLREAGIQVFVPNEDDRKLVADRIYNELEKGIVKESTLQEFQQIICRMKNEVGIEAVILGCTELPLILNKGNCPVECIDAVDVHINRLVQEALS